MRIRLSTDFLTGLLFLALGAFAIIYGSRYPIGTASRMGPGYYPLLVSSGLVLLGIVLVVRSFFLAGDELEAINPRPLFFVLIGTLAFGLLIEHSGFVLAGILVVFLSRFADRDFRLLEVSVLAACLVAFIAGLFHFGLGLPLKLLPF
jgi:hypothetical protein